MNRLEAYIEKVKIAVAEGKLTYAKMMPAIEELNSVGERVAYFNAYVDLTAQAIRDEECTESTNSAARRVSQGEDITVVARDVALDRFRHLINHYNNKRIHRLWNAAIPELKTAGGLAALC